ncbi:ankyrin repeat domain-containing protein [Endozoicomonas sp. ONNA2]|uniref:ankyrin repeat domain-containing protein n=1 Tax=Endozoicomonas sp. ONNA2 TaxID=2828741 RepID=UPI002147D5A7|nr:ankyrin repeat domain-containing protein [Endozoicomonas sp. ONNA2]
MQTIGSARNGSDNFYRTPEQANSRQGHTGCPDNVSNSSITNHNEPGSGKPVVFCGFSVYGRPAEFYGLCTRSGKVYPKIDCPSGLTLERLEEGSVRAVSHPGRHLPPGTSSGSDSAVMDVRLQAMGHNQVNAGCSRSHQCSPLLLAAKQKDASQVRLALLNGAGISETFNGMNALHQAVSNCDMAVLNELAQHPDFRLILNATNSRGASPLIQSAILGNWEITQRLLELGADDSDLNIDNESVLLDMFWRNWSSLKQNLRTQLTSDVSSS